MRKWEMFSLAEIKCEIKKKSMVLVYYKSGFGLQRLGIDVGLGLSVWGWSESRLVYLRI